MFFKSQGIIYLETSHKLFNDVVRITSFLLSLHDLF